MRGGLCKEAACEPLEVAVCALEDAWRGCVIDDDVAQLGEGGQHDLRQHTIVLAAVSAWPQAP